MTPRKKQPLTPRDVEVLHDLQRTGDRMKQHGRDYVKPLDIGGHNRSHHSRTLQKLARHGLVEVWEAMKSKPWRCRLGGGALYRITDAGRKVIAP